MRPAFVIALMCLSSSILYPQVPSAGDKDEVIEDYLQDIDEEEDVSRLAEDVEYGIDHPVNISTAHYGELLRVPGISPMVAMELLLLRDSVEVTSTEQLLLLPTMTTELYSRILPFIFAEPESPLASTIDLLPTSMHARNRMEQRLQLPRGVRDGKFLGDRYSAYHRIRVGNDRIEAAGIFEKDGGELYADGHAAGYGAVKNIGPLRTMVIGTFSVSSAQGLVLAKNIAATKGSNTVSQTKIRSAGITPTASADEYRYYNGIAGHFDFGSIAVTGFMSRRKVHASVDSIGTITSYFTSGLFRTANDKSKMKTVRESVAGGIMDYAVAPSARLSATFVRLMNDKYGPPALYGAEGKKHFSAMSVAGNSVWRNKNLYGEIATSDGRRFSKIFGLNIPMSRAFQTTLHYRAFSKGYVNPLARPFGERTNISDGERGVYCGMLMQSGKLSFRAYVDSYILPATSEKFGLSGSDVFLFYKSPLSKHLTVIVQIRKKEKKQERLRLFDDVRTQTNMRTEFSYAVNAYDRIRYRAEFVSTRYAPSRYEERGFISFVEGRCAVKQNALKIISRLAVFETDSFDSRVYQFESDVAGNVSNPPLYGKGLRWYIVAQYMLANNVVLSFKYAETKKLFTNVIGSGNDEILGSLDNSAAIQVDFTM